MLDRAIYWVVRSINHDPSRLVMSDSITKWWEGMIEKLEHDIECDISNVVLDGPCRNHQILTVL